MDGFGVQHCREPCRREWNGSPRRSAGQYRTPAVLWIHCVHHTEILRVSMTTDLKTHECIFFDSCSLLFSTKLYATTKGQIPIFFGRLRAKMALVPCRNHTSVKTYDVFPPTLNNKLRGLSLRANYTDRATAACLRS
jgi:hypothetical protein